jgi:signal transduction histidine kinase
MPRSSNRIGWAYALLFNLVLASPWSARSEAQALRESPIITNLAQLTRALSSEERFYGGLRLEVVVCGASRPSMGLLVVQDPTGVELLELGRLTEAIVPGERIRLQGERLLLRRRELGTQISAAPVVDNDGLHGWRIQTGDVLLKAGRVSLELDWFNCLRNLGLDVFCQESDGPSLVLGVPALWHVAPSPSELVAASRESPVVLGADNGGALTRRRYSEALEPGLQAEAYEGHWEKVPDFDLLTPVKSGTTTNCDVGFRTRDELVGLRFKGFFEAPRDGKYTFRVGSDDGTLLFIGATEIPVQRLGTTELPQPQPGVIGERMNSLEERQWLCIQGRVGFISRLRGGLQLELRSGVDTLSVTVVEAEGLEPGALRNTSVRAIGIGRAAISADERIVLDRLIVPDGRGLTCVDLKGERPGTPVPLSNISQVQAMPLEEAKSQVPVRIRGVITASNPSDHWVSLQDDTRGIFVDVSRLSNSFSPRAEVCEVVGHTAPGNFAPVVIAEQMQCVGRGRMPEPARPTWNELANGSMDVQWVEFRGLVSGVQSNRLNLLLPEGSLEVEMENYFEPELKTYGQALVHIRGTLFASWNANTREVRFGRLLMRNASISIDTPPLTDVFAAPTKTVRDLLLFDPHANALRPVKVRAQVLFADSQTIFAVDNGMGLRVLTAEAEDLTPGDLVEAVGYPEIGGPSPLLRQALVRRTSKAPLPAPKLLAGLALTRKGLDAMRVGVDGKLIGLHREQRSSVLELQSEGQLFMARLKPGVEAPVSLRSGSQLRVSGVYAEMGKSRGLGTQVGGFELLLNSAADIQVLSQPSWWTLGRLGTVVGVLIVGLVLAAAWITQLQRQVEQRTVQLQREIRERERVEHHRELEAERSRIARDLHDDLGSSLTEIGALASTGHRAVADAGGSSSLFEAIAGKARGSIAALDVIVWAVDPEDNSLQSLADYLSGFASEYLAHAGLSCRFKIPVSFPSIMLEGKVRHDLFLAVKETLNNIVRHSHATEVEFGMAATGCALEILVADNGTGFDASARSNGNGSKNLRDRLMQVGGSCAVDSQAGGGTRVRIRVPLDISSVSSSADADTTFD